MKEFPRANQVSAAAVTPRVQAPVMSMAATSQAHHPQPTAPATSAAAEAIKHSVDLTHSDTPAAPRRRAHKSTQTPRTAVPNSSLPSTAPPKFRIPTRKDRGKAREAVSDVPDDVPDDHDGEETEAVARTSNQGTEALIPTKRRRLLEQTHFSPGFSPAASALYPAIPAAPETPPRSTEEDPLKPLLLAYRAASSRRAADITIALKHRSERQEQIQSFGRWSKFCRSPEAARLDLLRALDDCVAADREILRIVKAELEGTLGLRERVGAIVDHAQDQVFEGKRAQRKIDNTRGTWGWVVLGRVMRVVGMVVFAVILGALGKRLLC
jgi:hypothetical protein